MHIQLVNHGRANRLLVGVVGVWDPPLQHHRDLFQDLSRRVQNTSFASLVITLDPPPASYALGEGVWTTHTDLEWRLEVQRQCGIDYFAVLRLDQAEVDQGARYFLEKLQPDLSLAELWLGAHQTLGRFQPGSRVAVETSCASLGISVRILEDITDVQLKRKLHSLLASGRVAEAYRVGGVPPVWRKPRGGELKLSWPPGSYTAISYTSVEENSKTSSLEQATSKRFQVELHRDVTWSRLTWPDPSIEWMAFLQGPGDELAFNKDERKL
jgi:hypothetical protein